MNKNIYDRVKAVSDYILNTDSTIRVTASNFSVSKSTIHKDISERLALIDYNKYKLIKNIMETHIENRHINGGIATRELFLRKR